MRRVVSKGLFLGAILAIWFISLWYHNAGMFSLVDDELIAKACFTPARRYCFPPYYWEANGALVNWFYMLFWTGSDIGVSPYYHRVPMLFASLVTLVGMYFIGSDLGGRKLAWGCVFLTAINTIFLSTSTHSRMYAPCVATVTWGTFVFLRWITTGKLRYATLYALIMSVSVGTMLLSVSLVVPHGIVWIRSKSQHLSHAWAFFPAIIIFLLLYYVDPAGYQRFDYGSDQHIIIEHIFTFLTMGCTHTDSFFASSGLGTPQFQGILMPLFWFTVLALACGISVSYARLNIDKYKRRFPAQQAFWRGWGINAFIVVVAFIGYTLFSINIKMVSKISNYTPYIPSFIVAMACVWHWKVSRWLYLALILLSFPEFCLKNTIWHSGPSACYNRISYFQRPGDLCILLELEETVAYAVTAERWGVQGNVGELNCTNLHTFYNQLHSQPCQGETTIWLVADVFEQAAELALQPDVCRRVWIGDYRRQVANPPLPGFTAAVQQKRLMMQQFETTDLLLITPLPGSSNSAATNASYDAYCRLPLLRFPLLHSITPIKGIPAHRTLSGVEF